MSLLAGGGLHYTRCLLSYSARLRAWLWVWAWTSVALSAGQEGVGRGTTIQDFPIAAEENFYSFNPDGTYTFSYDTGKGEHQSFRIEMRDPSGRVSGRFGYVDPDGALRITEYQADSSGYRASVEVYHQVRLAPPAPLIVGPLPKKPSKTEDPPRSDPSPPVMRPVGPAPFFPLPQPVLIIGPLPKPLQPDSLENTQESTDLDDDSLFTVPSNPSIPAVLPASPIPKVPPPTDPLNSFQRSTGLSILQGTVTDLLHKSSDDHELSPSNNATNILLTQVGNNYSEASLNSSVTSFTTPPTEKRHQHTRDSVSDDGEQTGTSNTNVHLQQQQPQLLSIDSSSVLPGSKSFTTQLQPS